MLPTKLSFFFFFLFLKRGNKNLGNLNNTYREVSKKKKTIVVEEYLRPENFSLSFFPLFFFSTINSYSVREEKKKIENS